MRRLRQKIEVDANRPKHLVTVRGVGYRLLRFERRGTAPMDDPAPKPPRAAASRFALA
jgi:hypothetical protein